MSFSRILKNGPALILATLIKSYQRLLSPWFGGQCRFYPSCSAYALEALTRQSLGRALWLIGKRVGSCHPFHKGGMDPVPQSSGGASHVD